MSDDDLRERVGDQYRLILQAAKRGNREAYDLAMKYAQIMTEDFDPDSDTPEDFYDALRAIAQMKSPYPQLDAIEALLKYSYPGQTNMKTANRELSSFLKKQQLRQ